MPCWLLFASFREFGNTETGWRRASSNRPNQTQGFDFGASREVTEFRRAVAGDGSPYCPWTSWTPRSSPITSPDSEPALGDGGSPALGESPGALPGEGGAKPLLDFAGKAAVLDCLPDDFSLDRAATATRADNSGSSMIAQDRIFPPQSARAPRALARRGIMARLKIEGGDPLGTLLANRSPPSAQRPSPRRCLRDFGPTGRSPAGCHFIGEPIPVIDRPPKTNVGPDDSTVKSLTTRRFPGLSPRHRTPRPRPS